MELHSLAHGKQKMKYTRKLSKFSSHELILNRLRGKGEVLDVGSSSGFLASDIKSKDYCLTCIDIEETKNISEDIDIYIKADLEKYTDIQLKGDYDYIIMADVIEHIRDSNGLVKYLGKYLRNKNSRIIVSVPNIAIWYYRLSLLFGEFNYTEKGTLDHTHVHFYTKKTIIKLLKESGYEPVWIEYSNLPFEVVLSSKWPVLFLSILDTVYRYLTLIWPTMFSYQYIIEAKKI
jgi:2-polyprenyl-3-methyl-5-hydroxy-6-metoxy-1,4-benzoquinol methylase